MTTEPKTALAGDFRPCENEPKASDPAPVREAVAWRYRPKTEGDWGWSLASHPSCHGYDIYPESYDIQPLYTDPLPVGREAVADLTPGQLLHELRRRFFNGGGWADYPEWTDYDEAGHAAWEESAAIIGADIKRAAALTGETSRE